MSTNRKSTRLLETVLSESLTADSIDREAGVIRGVKVLGRISRNGREYSDRAMDDGVRIYEGLRVNVDHPDRKNPKAERQFVEGFGELRNVHKEASGVFADLHFKKSHPSAELVCESAERFAKQFGLSHNAEGEVVKRGGKPIVESLIRAESVDIVGRPATNEGLFESVDEDMPMKTISVTLKSLIESTGTLKRYKKARSLLEMEGGDSSIPMMDEPVDIPAPSEEVPADADGDGQIDDAFKAMVVSVMDDESKDAAAKIARIKEIIMAQDKLMNGKQAESTDTETEETPVAESEAIKSIQSGLKTLLESQKANEKRWAEADAKSLLSESGREVTAERVTMMLKADEATRKQLLESWPKSEVSHVRKPLSTSRLLESTGEFPKDHKSFLSAIGVKRTV